MSGDRDDETGFASRWSRLKREAKAEAPEADADGETEAAAEPEAPAEDDRSDEEVLEELGLPDPDKLEPGDNFSGFMAKTVPARLRNRALRRLWISDPVLANLDELLDYGEDFTDAAAVIENLQTAYQVGKGYINKMAKVPEGDAESTEEPAGEPAEEPVEEPAGEQAGEAPGEPVEAGEEPGADEEEDLAPEDAPAVTAEEAREKAAPGERAPVRQRMRFRLAEE
ncbi:MAG: DUF3306 domain-containing protein [Alphaproteobacteria bacterium]